MTHRPTRPGLLLVPALLALCAGPLAAQTEPDTAAEDARAAEACTWSHGGGQLASALCEPGLDPAVWAAAGRAACDGQDLCAAWIYDDPAARPDPMPDSFDKLTQQNVTSALAVWVHEDDMLITIAPLAGAE